MLVGRLRVSWFLSIEVWFVFTDLPIAFSFPLNHCIPSSSCFEALGHSSPFSLSLGFITLDFRITLTSHTPLALIHALSNCCLISLYSTPFVHNPLSLLPISFFFFIPLLCLICSHPCLVGYLLRVVSCNWCTIIVSPDLSLYFTRGCLSPGSACLPLFTFFQIACAALDLGLVIFASVNLRRTYTFVTLLRSECLSGISCPFVCLAVRVPISLEHASVFSRPP